MAPPPGTAYNREWARRKRDELIAEMGAACARCGSWDQLEFDHPAGRDWKPSALSRWMRIVQYRRDWLAGQLRLLCQECNRRDGARRRWAPKAPPAA